MCRLLYAKKPFKEELEYLVQLEHSMGGDGNGAAFIKPEPHVIKGVKLTCKEIVDHHRKVGGPMLFHTRAASQGKVCDSLCQPFQTKYGFVAHNGHWICDSLLKYLSKRDKIKDISDSLVIAYIVDEFGFASLEEFSVSGVVLYMNNYGKLKYYTKFGSLCKSKNELVIASEPLKSKRHRFVELSRKLYVESSFLKEGGVYDFGFRKDH